MSKPLAILCKSNLTNFVHLFRISVGFFDTPRRVRTFWSSFPEESDHLNIFIKAFVALQQERESALF